MCDDTSKSNESTCQDTVARVREQTCTVRNLNRIKIITPIMSNISWIGITLHATKGRSATGPLRVLLPIALDFVSRPPESSPVKHTIFTHSSSQFKQHPSTLHFRWYPLKKKSLDKMNGIQCSKPKRMHVNIESSQSSPSKSEFTRTSRSHTTCVAVKANAQNEAARCQLVRRNENSVSACQLKNYSSASLLKQLPLTRVCLKNKCQPELKLDRTAINRWPSWNEIINIPVT